MAVPSLVSSLLSELHNVFRFFACILEVAAFTGVGFAALIAVAYELPLKRRAK